MKSKKKKRTIEQRLRAYIKKKYGDLDEFERRKKNQILEK